MLSRRVSRLPNVFNYIITILLTRCCRIFAAMPTRYQMKSPPMLFSYITFCLIHHITTPLPDRLLPLHPARLCTAYDESSCKFPFPRSQLHTHTHTHTHSASRVLHIFLCNASHARDLFPNRPQPQHARLASAYGKILHVTCPRLCTQFEIHLGIAQ
jgi:hypothetical protein